MNETDIAWFAGIFEGEGCFELTRQASQPEAARRVRLNISMSDRDVIDRINRVVPGTVNLKRSPAHHLPHHKEMWSWRCASMADVVRIIHLMMPWLGERRRLRAQEVLDAVAARPIVGSPRKPHCKNGHEMTPENCIPRSELITWVRCRVCAKDAWTRANRKRADRSGQVISA